MFFHRLLSWRIKQICLWYLRYTMRKTMRYTVRKTILKNDFIWQIKFRRKAKSFISYYIICSIILSLWTCIMIIILFVAAIVIIIIQVEKYFCLAFNNVFVFKWSVLCKFLRFSFCSYVCLFFQRKISAMAIHI